MTFDYAFARDNMVQKQLRPCNVKNLQVLAAFSTLKRELFVPAAAQQLAYADLDIPLAAQQVALRPALQARILQALELQSTHSVLVVGTGSGLLTGYCALLAGTVISIEIHPELSHQAYQALNAHGLTQHCQLTIANVFDWHPAMRFDAICLSGAVSQLPNAMMEWLHPQGRMLCIHGDGPVKNACILHGDAHTPTITSLFETDIPYLIGGEPQSRFQF